MGDVADCAAGSTIVLLTDFGLSDPYVGQMKGVLRALASGAAIVDLSHGVPAFRVETGAFFLASAYRYFPSGTIFLAIVDPWVGTDREILIFKGNGHTFVGPDNGILSLVVQNILADGQGEPQLWRFNSPPATSAGENGLTFAGRDIMAPLAARLCRGENLGADMEPVPLINMIQPLWAAPERTDNGILASVLHVDHFGNVILNLSNRLWRDIIAGADVWLKISSAGAQASLQLKLVGTYAELPLGKVGLVAGGQGYLELAMCRASAAVELSLNAGDLVHLGISG